MWFVHVKRSIGWLAKLHKLNVLHKRDRAAKENIGQSADGLQKEAWNAYRFF